MIFIDKYWDELLPVGYGFQLRLAIDLCLETR
jgi:hypothetical protein